MGGGGSHSENYADYEQSVHHGALELFPGGGQDRLAKATIPYDPRDNDFLGLDNDEAAELVMSVHQVVLQDRSGDTESANNPGFFVSDYAYGIDIDTGDISADNATQQDEFVESSLGHVNTGVQDDSAILHDARLQTNVAFDNGTDSTGGPSGGGPVDYGQYEWREYFGHGPFIDVNDEFRQAMTLRSVSTEAPGKIEWSVRNYWDITKTENSRASLAPPE